MIDLDALAADLRAKGFLVTCPVNVPSRLPALMVAGTVIELDPPGIRIRGWVGASAMTIILKHITEAQS